MGADGGTIPKRCELVKNKKKKEKLAKHVTNASRWRICRLSQEPLRRPVIACRLGGLYNKEAVINAILTKKIATAEVAKHIRSMKDVRELKLTDNKDYNESSHDKGDEYKDYNIAPFCCPVTSAPMNGNYSFAVNWKCGCVISERAIREVKSEFCHGCGAAFDENELVIINPPEEILRKYEEKLEEQRLKKAAKKTKASIEESATPSKLEVPRASESINSDEKKSIENITSRKAEKRKADDTNRPSGIQNDANKSSVYKSLFTTCDAAIKKPKQHWVTHNPLFY